MWCVWQSVRAEEGGSVDVAVVAAIVVELLDEVFGGVGVEGSVLLDDAVEGGVDVLGHAGGVAADENLCAVVDPAPELGTVLDHAVLDVDLVRLVAGEGGVETGEVAVVAHPAELVAVEEVGAGAPFVEEEPVATGGGEGAALVEEGAKGSDAGAGADHDDGGGGILREAEFLVRLDVEGEAGAGVKAIGEHGGGDAAALAVVGTIADDGHGGVELAAVGGGAGGDGVEAGGEPREDGGELFGCGEDAGVLEEEIDEAAVDHVALEVGLLLGCEEGGEGLAAAFGGEECDDLAGEAGDLEVVGEGFGEGDGAEFREVDGGGGAEGEVGEELGYEVGVVGGDDTAGVAGLVVDGRVVEAEGEVEGELAGDVSGERAAFAERGEEGVFAGVELLGVCGFGRGGGGAYGWVYGCGLGRGVGCGGEAVEEVELPVLEGLVDLDIAFDAVGDAGCARAERRSSRSTPNLQKCS